MQNFLDSRSCAVWAAVLTALLATACAVEDSGGPSVGDSGGTRDTGGGNDASSDAPVDLNPVDAFFPDAGSSALQAGTYFVAVDTIILPGALLWLSLEVTTQGATADFSVQPLRTDLDESQAPRENLRTPTGPPVTVESVPIEGGAFSITLNAMTIPGDANPITTGTAIVGDLMLTGFVLDDSTMCGLVGGTIVEPIEIDIDGSTFGALRFEGADFTAIEEPLSACPN